jgi:periplasmic protein TonB
MFNALESAWDHSANRRWTTIASFTMQAFGLSLLLAIPLLTVQGPPQLRWLDESPMLTPPPAAAPLSAGQHPVRPSNISDGHLLPITTIPPTILNLNEPQVGSAPDISDTGVPGGTGTSLRRVPGGIGIAVDIAPPPAPVPSHPIKISHWAEGNLIYRVQPVYPTLARQARVQGGVELRAIISKTGTIENLVVIRGHPMLATAAVEAVRHWRYRPYVLNDEPIEVETEITVNFVLSGN